MTARVIHLDGSGGRPVNAGDDEPGLEGIRALGHDRGVFYFLSPLSQQIEAFAPGELNSAAHLCRLRTLDWWEDGYPRLNSRQEFNVPKARQALMDAAYRVGVFDPELVRGRGIWPSPGGGALCHAGDWVTDDNQGWVPSAVPYPEIYEAAKAWPDMVGRPLDEGEGRVLTEVCARLDWAHPAYARLLAGWLVVAPVAACLRWRPHISVTGPKEAGKSFVLDYVIKPMLGPGAMHVQGDTTAAGIRQELGRDSRPITWDEAEGQGQRGQARVEEAIAFARHLSTSGGGAVIKGSAQHKAQRFGGVAVLCLVSIFVQLLRDADVSRFTVLELRSRADREDRDALKAADLETRRAVERLTPAFARDVLATTMAHIRVLRANHDTFASAVARRFGSQRLGDQLGALLAGWRLLEHYEPVSVADAWQLVEELPGGMVEAASVQSDEERCLARIASTWARVDANEGKRQLTRSLGELLHRAITRTNDEGIDPAGAAAMLLRFGIKVQRRQELPPVVLVANRHDRLAEIMRDSDFAGSWHRILERLPGAERWPTAVRFGPGVQARATALPCGMFVASMAGGTEPPDAGTESGTDVPSDVPP